MPAPRVITCVAFFRKVFTLCLALGAASSCCQVLASNKKIEAAPADLIETGIPSFVVYTPESLGLSSPPSDLKRLPDGRILVVSRLELAIGDGVRWEVYARAPEEVEVLASSVAVDAQGALYCCVTKGYARIEIGPDGHWRCHLLAPLPETGAQRSAPTLQFEAIAGRWLWHAGSGLVSQWEPGSSPKSLAIVNSIERIFSIDDRIFLTENADGSLLRLGSEGAIKIFTERSSEIGNGLTCATAFDFGRVLVGTNTGGIRLFDGTKVLPLGKGRVLGEGRHINDLCSVGKNLFAAALDAYGLLFFNREGDLLQALGKQMDHRLSRCLRLLYAPEGVLWVLLNDGIARVHFPSRFSQLDPLLATGRGYIEPLRHGGLLWLLCNGRAYRGSYDLDGRLVDFVDESPSNEYLWHLESLQGRLFASGPDCLYERTPKGWETLAWIPRLRFLPYQNREGLQAYAATGEVGLLDLKATAPRFLRHPVPELGDNYGAVNDGGGTVWLELGSTKVAELRFRDTEPELRFFGAKEGLPNGWVTLFELDGRVHFSVFNQHFRFDAEAQRFVPDLELLRTYPRLAASTGRPCRDTLGRLWFTTDTGIEILAPDSKTASAEADVPPREFRPYNFSLEPTGVLWMHDRHRFARYDPRFPLPSPPVLRALLTRLEFPGTKRILSSPPSNLGALDPGDNTLAVYFACPANPFIQSPRFELLLEGSHTSWVDNGTTGSAVFNQLKPGSYRLRIRPRSGDTFGTEASLVFTIRPPWFASPLAYGLYGLLGLVGLGSALFLPSYLHRRRQEKLSALIEERTHDLRLSEERFRHLSEDLERRVEERTQELQARIQESERLNTHLDRAAARLQEANASLLVANQELESFSYSVSHDLRAPLRNITGFIELLTKRLAGKLDRDAERYLGIVITETKRMSALIDDLLTFSRLGRAELKLEPVQLERLIEEVQKEFEHELAGRKVEWRIGELPLVLGDQTLLRQVISNLLGNALKFTRTRDLTLIEIGCAQPRRGEGQVTLFVRDNGVGFNPQYVDKLFRVFQRLHTSRDFEGTGIGLANVKRILSRHGGRVWAEGKMDSGATFYFTLKPIPKTV